MQAIDKAFERNAALILASEDWAKGYHDAPEQYAKMLKTAARLERKLIVFFREQARTCDRFINWYAYAGALQEVLATRLDAYDVNVIVTDNPADDNQQFIQVVFDDIATSMALGTQAAQVVYNYNYGLPAVDHTIQQQTRKQVASLVGKRVLPDGTIITNPNPDYVISNTTRKRIQGAIQTSLATGETIEQARKRVQTTIKDPKRAALIAHQEIANAYTSGIHLYGQASGAVGKQWRDNGATDICAVNTAAGPIPFDQPYPGGVQHPTQHIGCRCYERLIHQEQLDKNPDLFKKPKPAPAPAKPATTNHGTQAATLKAEEALIRHNEKYETFIAVDANGDLISKLRGGNHSVDITEAISAVRAGKDVIMSHNHPGSNSFSLADIRSVISGDAKEMRAVSAKWDYSITKPEGGWPTTLQAARRYGMEKKRLMLQTRTEYRLGRLTEAQATAYIHGDFYHDVNAATAAKLGYTYTRSKPQ